MSENERALASELNELNETNEICEMSEQLVSMLRDEAEIIWSEADGSIYYTTKVFRNVFAQSPLLSCILHMKRR